MKIWIGISLCIEKFSNMNAALNIYLQLLIKHSHPLHIFLWFKMLLQITVKWSSHLFCYFVKDGNFILILFCITYMLFLKLVGYIFLGTVFVTGGVLSSDNSCTSSVLSLSTIQKTWEELPEMIEKRYSHASVAYGKNISIFYLFRCLL